MGSFSLSAADCVNCCSACVKPLWAPLYKVRLVEDMNLDCEVKSPTNNESETDTAKAARSELLLRSEVSFWHELLESCDENVPAENRERMKQALALAEFRLNGLFENHQNQGNNVYYLDNLRSARA